MSTADHPTPRPAAPEAATGGEARAQTLDAIGEVIASKMRHDSLDVYRQERALFETGLVDREAPGYRGTYEGCLDEAESFVERLRTRGFDVVRSSSPSATAGATGKADAGPTVDEMAEALWATDPENARWTGGLPSWDLANSLQYQGSGSSNDWPGRVSRCRTRAAAVLGRLAEHRPGAEPDAAASICKTASEYADPIRSTPSPGAADQDRRLVDAPTFSPALEAALLKCVDAHHEAGEPESDDAGAPTAMARYDAAEAATTHLRRAIRAEPDAARADAPGAGRALQEAARLAEDALAGASTAIRCLSSTGMADTQAVIENARKHVRAALAQAGQDTEGWQDIVTAPKDGTVVDLLTDQGNRLTNRQWLTGAQRDPERCGPSQPWEHLRMDGWALVGSNEGCGCLNEKHLTHWRPLPAPPARPAGGTS